MGNPDRGRLIQALLNQYREACVIFATRQPGDPLGGEKADAELKARAAILAALTEAREGALREAAPVWTTTACPHCGGEVDGIRVLKESTLASRPEPEPAPGMWRCAGFPNDARDGAPRCCDRAGEYNGFGSDGPTSFTCPKGCACHD